MSETLVIVTKKVFLQLYTVSDHIAWDILPSGGDKILDNAIMASETSVNFVPLFTGNAQNILTLAIFICIFNVIPLMWFGMRIRQNFRKNYPYLNENLMSDWFRISDRDRRIMWIWGVLSILNFSLFVLFNVIKKGEVIM